MGIIEQVKEYEALDDLIVDLKSNPHVLIPDGFENSTDYVIEKYVLRIRVNELTKLYVEEAIKNWKYEITTTLTGFILKHLEGAKKSLAEDIDKFQEKIKDEIKKESEKND